MNDAADPSEFVGGAAQWIPSQRALGQSVQRGWYKVKGQTLMQRGILAKSVTYRADARSVTIGTNLVYGAIHHFGGQAGRNKSVTLPARPWLVVQPEDYEEIEEAALSFFERVFGGA